MDKITNYKLQITNKFQILKPKFKKFGIYNFGYWRLFVICCLVLGILLPVVAGAWVIGDPIVPCGPDYEEALPPGVYGPPRLIERPDCSQCELLHLVDNLVDFILIGAAPILATLFFIIAGVYMMLGGANPSMLATGKRMFSSAFIGILIVMLAWLATNTLITSLIAQTLVLDNMPFNSSAWWQLTCSSVGLSEDPPGSGYAQTSYGGGGGGGCNDPVCITGEQANADSNSVTITWTTNIPATSQVYYNNTSNLGTGSTQRYPNPENSSLVIPHTVTITGLTSSFLYYYQVHSTANGFPAVGSGLSFRTDPVACTDPVCITGELVSNVPNVSTPTVIVTWTTSAPANSEVRYGPTPATPLTGPINNNLTTSHSVTISGLNPNFQYYYHVRSRGGAPGNFPAVGSVIGPFMTLP